MTSKDVCQLGSYEVPRVAFVIVEYNQPSVQSTCVIIRDAPFNPGSESCGLDQAPVFQDATQREAAICIDDIRASQIYRQECSIQN
jgi:hypothetical protein